MRVSAGLVGALGLVAIIPAAPAAEHARGRDQVVNCPAAAPVSIDTLLAQRRYWHAARASGALAARIPPRESLLIHVQIAEGLGRTARADDLLRRLRAADTTPADLAALARSDERAQHWAAAAARYRRILLSSTAGAEERTAASVRLALQFERLNARDSAIVAWRRAAQAVPDLADWFAIRRAGLEADTAVAFAAVGGSRTPGARARAETFIADRRLRAGNAAGALQIVRDQGRTLEVAHAEFALGRAREARAIADSILLQDPRRPDALLAATFLTERFDTLTLREAIAVSRAYRARGDQATAERFARRAVQRYDTSLTAWMETAYLQAEQKPVWLALRTVDSAAARAGVRRATIVTAARVRVLMIADRMPEADTLLAQLIRAHHGDTSIARVVLERADRHRAKGEGADERTLYGALVRLFPTAPATAAARFRYGLQLYAAGQPDSAWTYVTAAERADTAGALGLGPRYWHARLALERGDTTGSTGLRTLARAFPLQYYGVRARQLLGDTDFLVDSALALPHPGSFPPARARERVRLLAVYGFDVEARAEATGWLDDPAVSVHVLLAAAQAAADAGFAREAIALGEAARARAGMTPAVARAIFPRPWRSVIEAEAAEQCVDPALVAALIRQESRFDVRAVSRAGARGMSQVMPATAAQMAARLHLGPFDPELLFVPDYNLHLGTRYLREREDHDHFPPLPLLASYNAGAGRVGRWRSWPEFTDADLFAERVFIPETRDYVRNVYASFVWYRYAWPQPSVPDAAPSSLP